MPICHRPFFRRKRREQQAPVGQLVGHRVLREPNQGFDELLCAYGFQNIRIRLDQYLETGPGRLCGTEQRRRIVPISTAVELLEIDAEPVGPEPLGPKHVDRRVHGLPMRSGQCAGPQWPLPQISTDMGEFSIFARPLQILPAVIILIQGLVVER